MWHAQAMTKTKFMTLRVTSDLLRRLDYAAASRRQRRSRFVRDLLDLAAPPIPRDTALEVRETLRPQAATG